MLLNIKGDFPCDEEPLVYGRCRFLVLDVTDHRITEVRVMVMPSSCENGRGKEMKRFLFSAPDIVRRWPFRCGDRSSVSLRKA